MVRTPNCKAHKRYCESEQNYSDKHHFCANKKKRMCVHPWDWPGNAYEHNPETEDKENALRTKKERSISETVSLFGLPCSPNFFRIGFSGRLGIKSENERFNWAQIERLVHAKTFA